MTPYRYLCEVLSVRLRKWCVLDLLQAGVPFRVWVRPSVIGVVPLGFHPNYIEWLVYPTEEDTEWFVHLPCTGKTYRYNTLQLKRRLCGPPGEVQDPIPL